MTQSSTQPLSTAQRMALHSIFNAWLAQACEDDYEQLEAARVKFAPNQVCSSIRLIQGCLAQRELEQLLPESLRQLMKERNWPQPCADVSAVEG